MRALQMKQLRELNSELLETLKDAAQHLDYCGYGDDWERECADESHLRERIEAAIGKAEGRINE